MNVKHGRFAFFRSPLIPGGNNTTVVSGSDFGTVQTGGFSRITAMFIVVGSMTLQFRSGVHSGNYQVNSSIDDQQRLDASWTCSISVCI